MAQTDLKFSQYRNVIIEAKRRLSNPDAKFDENTDAAMSSVWLAGLSLHSESTVEQLDKNLAAEFWNEIQVLTACLEELGAEIIPLAEWQKGGDKATQMFTGLNRQATALQLWDWYAVPVRYAKGRIVLLRAPDDVQFGVPTIAVWDPQFFLGQFGAIQAQHQRDVAELTRKSHRWELIASVGLLILGAVVYGWISQVFGA